MTNFIDNKKVKCRLPLKGSRGIPYAGGGPHCRGFPYGALGDFFRWLTIAQFLLHHTTVKKSKRIENIRCVSHYMCYSEGWKRWSSLATSANEKSFNEDGKILRSVSPSWQTAPARTRWNGSPRTANSKPTLSQRRTCAKGAWSLWRKSLRTELNLSLTAQTYK